MSLNQSRSSLMASSSLACKWRYNVFMSFHGPDVRKTFLSHLSKQFYSNGITMFDDQRIERGQSIVPSLIKAIRESRISIVVLSKNYASSSWCLDELVEILKCREDMGQIIMTVFYGVDPSNVRKQTGEFGRVFKETCAGKTEEDRKRWSQALTYVGNIAGEHSQKWDIEANMIEKIAKDVSEKLNITLSRDFDGMVGLEAHLTVMKTLLDLDYDGVKIVAIHGPAGIGKTTIARALQSRLSSRFQLTCFLENLRGNYHSGLDEYGLEMSSQQGLLLSKILNQDHTSICHLGARKKRLRNLKVLVILDDVNDVKQLEALVNDTAWFGPGSRIIVTTENMEVLQRCGINNTYHVPFPSLNEALEILCRNAFGKSYPHDGYEELAESIISKLCGNLPLVLRVVGSCIQGKNEDEWEDVINRLETNIDPEDILRVVGYESLDEYEQMLFLHAAIFFNGKDGDLVKDMLANNNLDIIHVFRNLADKFPVDISTNGEIVMPKLLQQVGRQAIHRQVPWKRKILIAAQEICDVLENDTGTRDVSGISFDTSGINEVTVSDRAFKMMPNLQFLHVYKSKYDGNDRVHIPEEMKFPPRLRLLHWEAYPSKSLPLRLRVQDLVELNMQYSQLEMLWEGVQPLANLKKMDLSKSYHLKEIPDLSTAINLERLDLDWCEGLEELPSSIGNLHKLEKLRMNYCSSLEVIPTRINLASLEWLYMDGCSRLRTFPDFSTNIKKLYLSRTDLVEIPPSIGNLHKLEELWMDHCSSLEVIPTDINLASLETIHMRGCSRLRVFPYFSTNIKSINLSECTALVEIPSSIRNLHKLEVLEMNGCSSLEVIPTNINLASLERIEMEGCSRLTTFPDFSTNIETETIKSTATTECVLVFSCNDNNLDDVEEIHFIQAILKELQEREVTPLTYDLSGRDKLDAEMVRRSSVGILVVSNSFAPGSHSLDNLVALMEHWKAKDLVIIPVYFKVTHSDFFGFKEAAFPQNQNSAKSDSFHKWRAAMVKIKRFHKWKAAMAEIASIIDRHEWTTETHAILAEEVARNACLKLCLKKSNNLVRILALLNQSQPPEADIVGLWGMAGTGKTSIAREIFGILAPQYDLCYFLQDFDRMCQEKGLKQMRDDFYSLIFGEEKLSIGASNVKPSFMRDWFQQKKILLVLDDVSNAEDAEAVVGGFSWFSQGHRIIITSRRKQVLLQCKVKEPYEIQNLSEFESSRLCKLYLNGESEVISEITSCSSGIPLALKVLCSSVSKQHISSMKEHLQSLRRNPPAQIREAFQRSFDELDANEKNIFLDLACFFRGENKDDVVRLLNACGFHTSLGIRGLIEESLISLVDNRIEVPIPFQDIGRFIVHEEDEDPCERSRLWDSHDIADVLTKKSETEAIEGIFMDVCDFTCELELSPTVFDQMYGLRLLKLYCSTSVDQCKISLPQGLDIFPNELRLLHWENYPLKYLPQKFNPENLVELNMPYSNMEKLWKGKKNLEKLKKIKLIHSTSLADILVLSEALNLEDIDLEGCTSLVDISTSIPHCRKLVSLNMKDCSRLRSLPAMFHLTSLQLLNMSGCSELEEIQDFAPNLKEVYLAGTAIRELPLSIENLTELGTLDLENCIKLQQLPSGIKNSRSILELKLSGCISLELGSKKRKGEFGGAVEPGMFLKWK